MLERLRQLLPPPAEPVEPGRPGGLAAVEAALGTGLPGDFNAFTELYCSGTVSCTRSGFVCSTETTFVPRLT